MTDLILYGAIAGVLCLMLFFVLGKDVGEAPDKASPLLNINKAGKTAPQIIKVDPAFSGPGGEALQDIAQFDDTFNPQEFLQGAGAAYSIILEAYAEGDKDTLKELLDASMYEAYSQAIDNREALGQTQTTDLARLITSEFSDARRDGKLGSIDVRFESELASALYDAEHNLVDGDPDLLSRVNEIWTFERKLSSKDPNWRLVGVQEEGGDSLGSAPDFDPSS